MIALISKVLLNDGNRILNPKDFQILFRYVKKAEDALKKKDDDDAPKQKDEDPSKKKTGDAPKK